VLLCDMFHRGGSDVTTKSEPNAFK
jgi:hypothetical protein